MIIRALFFDFDGVFADTLPDHLAAWEEVLKDELGVPLVRSAVLLNEGRPVKEIAQAVLRAAGVTEGVDLERLIELKNRRFRERQRAAIWPQNLRIMEEAARRDVAVGLVTGTKHENLKAVIPEAVLAAFSVVIGDGDAARGKPAPDPYLTAAERLRVEPSRCVVVENAPAGISAAKAAGMFCVALTTTLTEEHLLQADVILRTHDELAAWFESQTA